MKTYTEMAEEALRRRDAYIINRKKTIKKTVLSVSLVLVFAVFGGGAFIGISHLNAPDTPPVFTAENTTADTSTEISTESAATTVPDTKEPEEITGDTYEVTEAPSESDTDAPDTDETDTEEYTDTYTDPWSDPWTDTYDEPQETDEPVEDTSNEPVTEPPTEPHDTEPPVSETETDPPKTEETTSPPSDTDVPDAPGATEDPPASVEPEPPSDTTKLWQTVTHPAVGIPKYWGEIPEGIIPPSNLGPGWMETPGNSLDFQIPSTVYYSTEFDFPDYFFLTSGDSPIILPNYVVDKEAVPSAKAQTDKFLKLLYGENVPVMGEYMNSKDEVVYATWDDAIVESGYGKFIAADGDNGNIYFTVDLANPETVGGGYRDMTHTEAFEYISRSEYYKAAVELLGLSDTMVTTEIHRYYSGNLYEYRFSVTESADNLETALFNHASANVEIQMRYYPDYGVIRAYFVINYPRPLTQSGNSEFYSYNEQIEMLKAAFKEHGYSPSYAEHVLITFRSGRNFSGIKRPYLHHYLGYTDEDGGVRYVEISIVFT